MARTSVPVMIARPMSPLAPATPTVGSSVDSVNIGRGSIGVGGGREDGVVLDAQ